LVVDLHLQLGDTSLERSHLITQLVLAVLDNRRERLVVRENKKSSKMYLCKSLLGIYLLELHLHQHMFFLKLRHTILGGFTGPLRLSEGALMLVRPIFPFGRTLLCLCQAGTYSASCTFATRSTNLLFFESPL
jgi:hypothetical protein